MRFGPPLTPAAVPEEWDRWALEGVSVAAPSAWELSETRTGEHQTATRNLQDAPNNAGTRAGVQVTAVGRPQMTAGEMADALRQGVEAISPLQNVENGELSWPGATSAWFVSFVARVPTRDAPEHRSQCLVLDLEDGTQRHVTVTALTEEFEALQMREILASVTVL